MWGSVVSVGGAFLAGGGLGVGGTLWRTSIQERAANKRDIAKLKEERRKEHKEVVASFSTGELALWEEVRNIDAINDAIKRTPARSGAFPNPELTRLHVMQESTMGRLGDETVKLQERLSLVRITVPELGDAASELWSACRRPLVHGLDDVACEKRAMAREAFERSAAVVLK
ncbi:membrane protein [Arthrobacter phage Vulpecula]|nr:membrane protein [Arthrobacter phage Vulpecula]